MQPLEMPATWTAWFSTQAPVLPAPAGMPWAWHAAWALVLAGMVVVLAARLPRGVRALLGAAVLLWTLLPGPWSPAFALGLVFQGPSLVTVLLCLRMLWTGLLGAAPHGLTPAPAAAAPAGPTPLGVAWSLCAVLLGWALLLDSFALLPVQLYAAGFGRASLLAVLVVVGGLWVLRGAQTPGLGAGLLLALLLFALWRWPSGNLWDALLDPLLWLCLQVRGLWLLLRAYVFNARPVPAAIRA